MIAVEISAAARSSYGGWSLGLLEVEALLPRADGRVLDAEVALVEEGLKSRYGNLSRKEIARTEPPIAYEGYFSRSGKAYPVLLQAEGVASKGRRIAMSDPLIRAMFGYYFAQGICQPFSCKSPV